MEEELKLVIGIDIGTADSYIGYVNKGAVDCVQNEVSQRKTPSLVGFTDRERLLGDSALSQIKSNSKNSCRNFKHLLGQKLDHKAVETEKFWSTCDLVTAEDGYCGYDVNFKGEKATFSATDVTAMFLTKLKDVTEAWGKGKVADVVIGVPSYFSDFQRTALLDAAKIANLNVLRVMNEHTAVALEYGFFRSHTFDAERPTTVAFCQMGHSVFSVAIVQYLKGKLIVVYEKSSKVGGRDMDECLIRTFAEQFKKKTGCDVLGNKKACFKLEDAVGKTKKVLSANNEAPVSCECLMDDQDFSSTITRADFLEMCKPMMQKVSDVLESVKTGSGIPLSAIDAVEICGGASRVPWVKDMCSAAFGGKELSTTMNADECVARGCALQAAILSPLFKTREFKVEDRSVFPVQLGWQAPSSEGKEKSSLLFPGNTQMNLLKVITFYRQGPFELKASYDEKMLPDGMPKELGTYTIEVPAGQQPVKVKVKTALTVHGTFSIQSAQIVEDDPEAPVEAADSESAQKKQKVRRTDLAVRLSGCPGLAPELLQKSKSREESMIMETLEIVESNARKNDLESYILTMRSAVVEGGKYAAYISDADRTTLTEQLRQAEDWLYDHLDDPKEVFVAKLAELKLLGGPAEARYKDQLDRPELVHNLEEFITKLKARAQSSPVDGVNNLETACNDAERWLADLKAKQAELTSPLDDAVLSCAQLAAKSQELQRLEDSVFGGSGAGAGASPEAEVNGASIMELD